MELPDPRSRTHLIVELAGKDTTCLAVIDHCGMTVFNHLQIPQLIRELEKAKVSITEKHLKDLSKWQISRVKEVNVNPPVVRSFEEKARLRSHKDLLSQIDGILKMAHAALAKPHLYLRFVGD